MTHAAASMIRIAQMTVTILMRAPRPMQSVSCDPPSGDEPEQYGHHGHHDQYVNETTQGIAGRQAKRPQDE